MSSLASCSSMRPGLAWPGLGCLLGLPIIPPPSGASCKGWRPTVGPAGMGCMGLAQQDGGCTALHWEAPDSSQSAYAAS